MKKIKLAGLLSLIIIGTFTSMTAFAGEWKTVTKPTGERWRYENSDGTYALDGWFWLDGNRDGISECYYFNDSGWMLADAMTPDSYFVNKDGNHPDWRKNLSCIFTEQRSGSGTSYPASNDSNHE